MIKKLKTLALSCSCLPSFGSPIIKGALAELSVDDIQQIHLSLIQRVQENRVSEERRNDAADRILHLKKQSIFSKTRAARSSTHNKNSRDR